MSEIVFEIQLPLDSVPADLSELESVIELHRKVQNIPQPRDDEFDTRYRSDSMFVEVISWVVGSATAGGVAIAQLKSVLATYLKTRKKEVSLTIGKNTLKMSGPLSQKQIDEIIDKFIDLNAK